MTARATRLGLFFRAAIWFVTMLWLAASVVVGQRQVEDLRSRIDAHSEKITQNTEHLSSVERRVKTIEDMDIASRLTRIETYLLGIFVPVFLMGLETLLRLGGRVFAMRVVR